jgi:hypothetical protein
MGFFSTIQNQLSATTFGLIPRDASDDIKAESFEDKFNKLKSSGAYGTSGDTGVIQNTNLGNIHTGFNQLVDLGTQLQNQDNSATGLYDKTMQDSAQAIAAQAQLAPVSSADALRAAQDAYDTQRAQAIKDEAYIKAGELQNNAGQLASVGSNMANQYSDAYNTNLFGQAGLEQNRSANQNRLDTANQQALMKENNALLGAGALQYCNLMKIDPNEQVERQNDNNKFGNMTFDVYQTESRFEQIKRMIKNYYFINKSIEFALNLPKEDL